MTEIRRERLNIAMICDPIGNNKSGVVVSSLRFGRLLKERGSCYFYRRAIQRAQRKQLPS